LDDLKRNDRRSVRSQGSAVSKFEELTQEVILWLNRLIDAVFDHHDGVVLELGLECWHDGRAVDVERAVFLGKVGSYDDSLHGRVSGEDKHVIEPVVLVFSSSKVENFAVSKHHLLLS